MTNLHTLPELAALDAGAARVRIPPDLDVPLTPRVRRVIDSAAFRRLARISQLGLVSLVYPAAHHSRFEHSLGVYRLALLFLRRFASDEAFTQIVDRSHAELFIAAALLHDVGHWPFCHPIEDVYHGEVPRHEQVARQMMTGEIADALRDDWATTPEDVARLLDEGGWDEPTRLLASMLSGPLDVDKLDYLARDSLHAGVPYGRNFDQNRLIGALCLDPDGEGLAISTKGKTAAEMMVFARYVMFSEVYWHHAVRSATAMFQRAFAETKPNVDLGAVFLLDEPGMIAALRSAAPQAAAELFAGLFGERRGLYKRLAEYSFLETPEVYRAVAGRPFDELVSAAEQLAACFSRRLGRPVPPHHVLIDAPPREREVEFRVNVVDQQTGAARPLAVASPVVRTLAREQFDDYVKRVRVFVHPALLADGDRAALADLAADELLARPS